MSTKPDDKRPQKWFSKDGQVLSSTAPVDHVRLRSTGWAQHDTKEAASKAADAPVEAKADAPAKSTTKSKSTK